MLVHGRITIVYLGIVIYLVFATSTLSIASLYDAPRTIQPNTQITRMDMAGMKWFIDRKDANINTVEIYSSIHRFADGIIGVAASDSRPDLKSVPLVAHFGYDANSSLGSQYPEDKYVVLNRIDRILYSTVWRNVGRFSDSDFYRLEQDSAVSKLYSNDEGAVYYISSFSKGE